MFFAAVCGGAVYQNFAAKNTTKKFADKSEKFEVVQPPASNLLDKSEKATETISDQKTEKPKASAPAEVSLTDTKPPVEVKKEVKSVTAETPQVAVPKTVQIVKAPQITSTASPASSLMLSLVNTARTQSKLTTVNLNSKLNAAALTKSKDMYNQHYFAHVNPQGKDDFYFVSQAGYKFLAAGSNIAEGNFGGDKGVFEAWMQSPGHRANILAGFGQEIGYAEFNGYYTLIIAKPL